MHLMKVHACPTRMGHPEARLPGQSWPGLGGRPGSQEGLPIVGTCHFLFVNPFLSIFMTTNHLFPNLYPDGLWP